MKRSIKCIEKFQKAPKYSRNTEGRMTRSYSVTITGLESLDHAIVLNKGQMRAVAGALEVMLISAEKLGAGFHQDTLRNLHALFTKSEAMPEAFARQEVEKQGGTLSEPLALNGTAVK